MKKKAALFAGSAALVVFALMAVACGTAIQAGKDAFNLTLIGAAYKSFVSSKGKGPASADELMQFTSDQGQKDAIQEVKNGKYTIIWGVNTNAAGVGSQVLGYGASPIDGQRVILTCDGQVTNHPESKFQTMTKAKPGGGDTKKF